MPLWALAITLATGKNTRLFGVLDQNENGFFTYVTQRAESKAATVATSDLIAWVASRWQGTSCSSSFVSKVLGANYNKAKSFHPQINSPCMWELTFKPTSNAHARVDLLYHLVGIGRCCITYRPDNNKTKSNCPLPWTWALLFSLQMLTHTFVTVM